MPATALSLLTPVLPVPSPCLLQYCLRKGVYSPTVPEDLASLPGEPCEKIDGLTCIRWVGQGGVGWVGEGGSWRTGWLKFHPLPHPSHSTHSTRPPACAGTARPSSPP